MKTAALYARVSTRHQEQEATIESQIAQLMGYAQQQGYEISPSYQFIDQAISGDQLARPGLDRLRDTAMTGELQVVLCLSPDRMARNLGVQHVVLGELRRCGVEVIFMNQPSLGDGPQEQLLLNMQGAFAEYERTLIKDRLRRGRLHRLRQGQSVPWPAPYGYHYQAATATRQSTWEIDQAKATIVQHIFERYTDDGLSLTALAHQLNGQGVPGPKGKQWQSSTVGRILRQPAYQGTAYFNRSQTDTSGIGLPKRQGQGRLRFPRYQPRPAEEWIAVPVSAIISEPLWQVAQERLERNAHLSIRNMCTNTYLLRGLLVCGVCGRTLQGRAQKGVTYYRCPGGGKHRSPETPQHSCSVRADVVEGLLWEALADLLHHPDLIQDAWQTHQAQLAATPSQVSRQQQRKDLLQRQRQRLLDAYQSGALSLQELTERQNPLVLELQKLETQLASSQSILQTDISLEHFTRHIDQALNSTDLGTRQEVIRLLIERIVVSDEALTVEHIIPTVNDSLLHPTLCAPSNSTFWRG